MPELQRSLEKLALRLDRMGLQVAQVLDSALRAVRAGDAEAGRTIAADDAAFDQEEVEIEKECINLLALYQPKAVDLRRICCIIKANNDLERIADIAARMGRRVKHLAGGAVRLDRYPAFDTLEAAVRRILSMTVRMLNSTEPDLPRQVIEADREVDAAYDRFTRSVLEAARLRPTDIDTPLTLILLARSMERVGDHCTNIAEDIFYLLTGDIVRHSPAFKSKS